MIAFVIALYSLALAGLLFLVYLTLLVVLVLTARGGRR